MNPFPSLVFSQASPSVYPSGAPAVPILALVALVFPVLMIISGTLLGFRALRDIRLAEGKLGGVVSAMLAAGLFPAAVIVLLCGGGMVMIAEDVSPHWRSRSEVWGVLGGSVGVWLSFLMMRAMYRRATGWVPPAAPGAAADAAKTPLAAAAIVLTITGTALSLTYIIIPPLYLLNTLGPPIRFAQLALFVLVGGLICGVLSRRDQAGRVCAWICGVLFLVLLLTFAI